jgi:hypothetical protein
MGRCFVMQPFDDGPFDDRYEDVFAPAIINAGLEPYRVDRDPNVTIPIDEIEEGIRNADVCLAEISLDKPNVWYELGFAIAAQKEVILVCIEDRRSAFPFDVQHRTIIRYRTEAPRDFEIVKEKVTNRLKAILAKGASISKASELSPTVSVQGLQNHEISCLICIAQPLDSPDDSTPAYLIRQDMERYGYTDIAVAMALNSLVKKDMSTRDYDEDINGNKSYQYSLTTAGFHWLEENQNRIVLQVPPAEKIARSRSRRPAPTAFVEDDADESDPFADE